MSATTITIPGKPFAWRRARSNGAVRFKDAATVAHEQTLQAIALQHFPQPLEGPVSLDIRACFKVPASWSKKKAAEHLWRYHVAKPDADNIAKMIGDSWNRIAWLDDGQIALLSVRKVWGDKDQTIVVVEAI